MHTFGIWFMTVQTGGIRYAAGNQRSSDARAAGEAVIPFRFIATGPTPAPPAVNNVIRSYSLRCFPPLRGGTLLANGTTVFYAPVPTADHRR